MIPPDYYYLLPYFGLTGIIFLLIALICYIKENSTLRQESLMNIIDELRTDISNRDQQISEFKIHITKRVQEISDLENINQDYYDTIESLKTRCNLLVVENARSENRKAKVSELYKTIEKLTFENNRLEVEMGNMKIEKNNELKVELELEEDSNYIEHEIEHEIEDEIEDETNNTENDDSATEDDSDNDDSKPNPIDGPTACMRWFKDNRGYYTAKLASELAYKRWWKCLKGINGRTPVNTLRTNIVRLGENKKLFAKVIDGELRYCYYND